MGSGNIVHHLGMIDWGKPDVGFDWAHRFNEAALAAFASDDPTSIVALESHQDYANAVPTPDHFLPAVYLAGLAAASGESPGVLIDGYAFGSLSMTSLTLGT